jgi:hypothetical protein
MPDRRRLVATAALVAAAFAPLAQSRTAVDTTARIHVGCLPASSGGRGQRTGAQAVMAGDADGRRLLLTLARHVTSAISRLP